MGALNYTAGKREYTLPSGAIIHFDPCDSEFANKIIVAVRNCNNIQNSFPKEPFTDLDAQLSFIQKMNGDIREEIDKAFGEPVCEKACCGSSPISLSDGLPVWMNFLMAVIDEIDANMPEGEKRSRARVQQYMEKYNTKYGKYVRK